MSVNDDSDKQSITFSMINDHNNLHHHQIFLLSNFDGGGDVVIHYLWYDRTITGGQRWSRRGEFELPSTDCQYLLLCAMMVVVVVVKMVRKMNMVVEGMYNSYYWWSDCQNRPPGGLQGTVHERPPAPRLV